MDTIAERLKYAIKISGKKKIDISRETGIDKGSISNYVNGRYEPKSGAIYKLARALNISEAWLLGYDVPMERETSSIETADNEKKTARSEPPLSDELKAILSSCSNLSNEKLKTILELCQLLNQQQEP